MAVAAPADRRFRRAHVSPGRRNSWRRSWWRAAAAVILLTVVAIGGYALIAAAAASPALAIDRIAIRGNVRVSSGDAQALLDGLRGTNLLTADLDVWRQKLLASPWVADADMRRVFPDAVLVVLSERQVAALGRVDGVLYLIDRMGTVIDEFGPGHADLDLPIIDGLAAGSREGPMVDASRALLAGRLLSQLERRPDLARRISQIDVSDARDAAVTFKGDTAMVRVGDDAFAERLQSYLDLAPTLVERVQEIDYVDLRFDDRVYVKPSNSRPSPRPGARPGRARR
jgi:cell division protein FtsQ